MNDFRFNEGANGPEHAADRPADQRRPLNGLPSEETRIRQINARHQRRTSGITREPSGKPGAVTRNTRANRGD